MFLPRDNKIKLAETILGKPISEWEIRRQQIVHPWASRELVVRMIEDHRKLRTTCKDGKRRYQRLYMREKRRQAKEGRKH